MNHLYPLELSFDHEKPKPTDPLNADAPISTPDRDSAVAARQRIQDVAELEE